VGREDRRLARVRLRAAARGEPALVRHPPEAAAEAAGAGARRTSRGQPERHVLGRTFWGVGVAFEDPKIQDPANWRGDNKFGQLLMALRAELMADGGEDSSRERSLSKTQQHQTRVNKRRLQKGTTPPPIRPNAPLRLDEHHIYFIFCVHTFFLLF